MITEKILLERLPHGSGINGKWVIIEYPQNFTATNFYEPMDENGYYDSAADFVLIIPKDKPRDFQLHFVGKVSQYMNRKYALREYLEDTVVECLSKL